MYAVDWNETIQIVKGPPQYKVNNGKGKTYYVTANEAYVYVK
ncbi:N-acetylmuramoyl-L-alanine amidase [Bacillus sp. XF8]|nr:N-acetylmuramoyl-L-alanine amidase [Bacillus sp. XF8]